MNQLLYNSKLIMENTPINHRPAYTCNPYLLINHIACALKHREAKYRPLKVN